MEMTYAAWIFAAGVAGAVLYAIRSVAGSRAAASLDAGVVSQSWLVEHRTTDKSDRFS